MDEDDAFGELTYGDDFEDYGNGGENFEEADDAENIETKEFSEIDNNDFNDNDIYDNGGGGPSKTKPKIRKEDKERKRKLKTIKKPPGIMTLEAKRRPNAFMEMSNSLKPGESVFNNWHLRIGEEELAAKRRRMEVENVVGQITLQILAARMAQKQRKSGGDSTFGTQFPLKNVAEKEECKLLELPPMDGYGWYGISSTDGNVRRYVPMRKKMRVMQSTRDALEGKTKDNAEMESYYEMVAQIEEQKQRRILEEMEATSTHLMECDESYGEKGLIWTQKYAPKNFLDLLTNDETNRLVLLWLRLWEAHVFRKKGPNFWESLNEKERTLMEVEHRKGGQILPKQKILVLYGSSGVGKSSLAQIAAKQAGYRPLILPMSEFHNVTELRNRLENAINTTAIQTHFQQMNMADEGDGDEEPKTSMTMISEKPVCFVVEGLELATADMIQFLCNWARRSGNETIIRRPIICTCASIWQNSTLKELRTGSMALRVQHCNRERLRKRLLEICRLEGIEMDRAELDELIHSHAQDIRLCLNTLQFMTANANQRHQTKTADSQLQPNEAMNTAMSVSILDVLAAIFTLDFHEDNRGIVRPPAQRVRSLLNLIGQLPQEDFTRLQQLIFTNFASILKLSNDQCLQIAQLLVEIDRLQNFIQQGQHFILGNYLVYRVLGVHFICAVHVSRRLHFNMAAQPFNERLRESQQIIRSLKTNAANGQCFLANGDLVWLLPHFHSVLQPYIQSANAHLHMHRSQEQRQLRRVVQLMHAYRLQYVLKFGSEAGGGKSIEAHYRFEPAFDQLTRFPLAPNPNLNGRHFALAESLKKFIAQQVELASTKASKRKKDDEELFDDEEHFDDYY